MTHEQELTIARARNAGEHHGRMATPPRLRNMLSSWHNRDLSVATNTDLTNLLQSIYKMPTAIRDDVRGRLLMRAVEQEYQKRFGTIPTI